jgi:hypothetical protein
MKAIACMMVLSIVLLSTAALAGEPATKVGRTEALGLTQIHDPVSRSSKAVVPGLISYQGTLTDTNGVVLNTIVSIAFSIYTDSTGGTQIWTETQPLVEIKDGLFDVLLGRVNAIPDTVFQDPERWLGVQVESDPELVPRQRLAAVGYAFRAAEADTADFARAPAPSDGDWIIHGNHMYSAVPGSVGIGVISPDARLHVLGGNIAVSDAGAETGIKIAESWIRDPYDGALHIQSGGDVVAFDGSDDVCIGTTAPSGKLTVDGGDAIIKGGDGWDGSGDEAQLNLGDYNHGVEAVYGQGLRVWTFDDASSDIRFRGHTGTDYMTIKMNSGKVGIGTTNPGSMLDVSGDVNTDSLYKIGGSSVLSTPGHSTYVGEDAGANDTGIYTTLVGYRAGYNNTASYCTAIGYRAGYVNESVYNTFVGTDAGASHVSGADNTFVGYDAGNADTSGYDNTFIGSSAGSNNTTGYRNTFLGSYAGIGNTTGHDNTYLGLRAGQGSGAGSGNTFIGSNAGEYNSGHNNTFLGTVAGYNTLGSSNVFIGFQAGFYETGSNKLYIANGSDTSNVLIYGDFSTGQVGMGTLDPNGELEIYKDQDYGTQLTLNNPSGGTNASSSIYFYEGSMSQAYISASNSGNTNTLAGPNSLVIQSNYGPVEIRAVTGYPVILAPYTSSSNVGIGTTSPAYKLDVDGDINTTGEIRQGGFAYNFPDYVFEPDYELMPLTQLGDFVATEKHLPGMPSAEEVKRDGVKLFEQNRLLVEKLEEAYLYILELQERISRLEDRVEVELSTRR